MKIGRNEPCPCGSGKKYKKCCYPKPLLLILQEIANRPEQIDNQGRLIGRPFIQTEFRGKRVRAVGSRFYHSLPLEETFHEFIIRVLKDVVGMSWGQAETQKPTKEQHIIVRWLNEMGELFRSGKGRPEDNKGIIKSIEPTGDVQSLLCLAYDIYSVMHCGDLPDTLVKRLKDKDNFQGARYEIAVAAIFARAGFDIEWVKDKVNKHCEFIATHKQTKEKVAVEAKSRHRPGVLETSGVMPDLNTVKTGVERVYNRALEQQPEGIPFLVFIDLNLSLTPELPPFEKKWFPELRALVEKHGKPTRENPDKVTALFITNFSWHYYGRQSGMQKSESLMIVPKYAVNPISNFGLLQLLYEALNQYGLVPHDV